MQMWPGRPPGGAHRSDLLATLHPLSLRHINRIQMGIARFGAIGVAQPDQISIATSIPRPADNATECRHHRCADRGRPIHTRMQLDLVQDGVIAWPKPGGQNALHRRRHASPRPGTGRCAFCCGPIALVIAVCAFAENETLHGHGIPLQSNVEDLACAGFILDPLFRIEQDHPVSRGGKGIEIVGAG